MLPDRHMASLMAISLISWLIAEDHALGPLGRLLAKAAVSTLFILAVVAFDPLESSYGRLVLAALLLSWLGDVLLVPDDNPGLFRAGIGAFALAHVAYIGAFLVRGVDVVRVTMALVPVLVAVFAAARWLRPHVPADMRVPVNAYMGIISAMVLAAAGASRADPMILVGALLFYVSDLSVARDRFVRPDRRNRWVGLPLYYGAQLVLATTVGALGLA